MNRWHVVLALARVGSRQNEARSAVVRERRRLTAGAGQTSPDRSNITGRFDLRLDWAPQPGSPEEVSLVTALREQLGLRLERQRIPMDTLVIEQVERPVEN